MDLFEKGKSLAQEGHYEDALDAFVLALENDKENADIHFYLGLCYSSLEEFHYAKFHYDMALKLKPNHAKTRLVYEGLKDVTPETPPERRITRQAAAKIRRAEAAETTSATPDTPEKTTPVHSLNPKLESKIKITDNKWENAFPAEELMKSEHGGLGSKIFMALVGIAIVAALVYYGLSLFR